MPTHDLDKVAKQKKLVVHANRDQITELKKLIPSLANSGAVKKKAESIYELFPEHTKVNTLKLLTQPTMDDLSSKTKRKEFIGDFENSIKFYKKAKDANKKVFSIISDEFSNERNSKLYEGISLIENKWREFVVLNFNKEIQKAPNPKGSGGGYDHKVSGYTLSELSEHFFIEPLYEPPSEEFVLARWNKSKKTDEDVVEISKMTKLYELGFPLRKKEFASLKETRNKVMHFRVITVNEYSQAVEIINKYLVFQTRKEFAETMNDILEASIKPILEVQELLVASMQPQIKFIDAFTGAQRALTDILVKGFIKKRENKNKI